MPFPQSILYIYIYIYIYIYTIAGDNREPIAKPSSYRYMCDPIPKCVVCVQKVNISIRLSTGILVRSSRDESEANLYLTTESASSVVTLLNKLTTSKLTIWLDRMGGSLIISTKWDEFQTYEGDFPINGSIISSRKRLGGGAHRA